MTIYAFSTTVTGLDLDDIAQLDTLYTDDFTILASEVDGVTSIDVEIDAETGEDALQTLVDRARSVAGVVIVRVDLDLVNIPEVALRLNVSRESVRLWVEGERGNGDFPRHRSTVGNQKVWAWADVYAWAQIHGRIDSGEPAPLDASCVDWFNGRLVPQSRAAGHELPMTECHGILPRHVSAGQDWNAGQARSIAALARHERIDFAARSGARFRWSRDRMERVVTVDVNS